MSDHSHEGVNREKVVIDTDTGVDDAMGLIYGLVAPELEVLAATSVFGNVSVELTTRNTALILETLGRDDVPLACGAARGLLGRPPNFSPEVHGADGMGETYLPAPTRTAVGQHAAELIVQIVRDHPGEVTLVALGPLTNLALAASLAPDIVGLTRRVIWMGGAVATPGNVTALAEADAIHDPEGAAMVLEAPWPVTVIGLDVTDNTLFREKDLLRVREANTSAAQLVAKIAPFYMGFYSHILGEFACAMHSPLTVAVAAHLELITEQMAGPMTVELNGTHTRGMTIFDRRRGDRASTARNWMTGPEVIYATDVDRGRFLELFVERICDPSLDTASSAESGHRS